MMLKTSFDSIVNFFSEIEQNYKKNMHLPGKNSTKQESQESAPSGVTTGDKKSKMNNVEPKQPKNYFYQENKDPMSEFVVVDFKESEPYSMEEWRLLLSNSKDFQIEQPRLYSSLHQGVPRDLRKRIWLYLANVDKLKQENAKKGITYKSLLQMKCAESYRIHKDIPRTFPNHEFFMENRKDRLQHLENVLHAYANYDPEVGYTQGMNFLVGTLIYYMHLERTEKDYYILDPDFESDVFWILVHIMQEKGWRDVYKDNTPKLVELLARLEDGIKRDLPRLHQLFEENALIPACLSQYFLTLMFYNSPLRFAKRVLDMFLLVGEDIIIDLLLKMLSLCEEDILAKQNVEELYPFLRSKLVEFTLEKHENEFSNLVNEQVLTSITEYI